MQAANLPETNFLASCRMFAIIIARLNFMEMVLHVFCMHKSQCEVDIAIVLQNSSWQR